MIPSKRNLTDEDVLFIAFNLEKDEANFLLAFKIKSAMNKINSITRKEILNLSEIDKEDFKLMAYFFRKVGFITVCNTSPREYCITKDGIFAIKQLLDVQERVKSEKEKNTSINLF